MLALVSKVVKEGNKYHYGYEKTITENFRYESEYGTFNVEHDSSAKINVFP